MYNCKNCIHERVCEKLEEFRDPLWWMSVADEFVCSFYDSADVVPRTETSFQEDLEFFVNDCTKAQLKALYERVGEKLKEKGI